jgi:UPF0755 protein
MKRFLSLIIVLAIFILGLFLYYNQAINRPAKTEGEDASFRITAGESVDQISTNLLDQGLIRSKLWFKVYTWQTKQEANFQAGEYMLNPRLSIKEIVKALVRGETIDKEKTITIIEGWKNAEINNYLKEQNILLDNSFLQLVSDQLSNWQLNSPKPEWLNALPQSASLEGYLFPDTYRIFKDATAEDIIIKMLNNFNSKLSDEMKEEIAKKSMGLHEIITMASIIEKEIAQESDRDIISGILYKRLDLGMRLEVDATVNYATGKNDPSVSLADLEIDSPYNTYKYYGLPPGPICNPSLSAIKAAIYPKVSPYLFYLNRQDTGETIFSKTFEEHVKNKNKYLK